ncbi:hypothetical protein Sango_2107300 [Sesamum angolense]|uniref:Uncharacterized protein n=1 Tax=Sesamum angolense TaxID=2727404 RepID=A0AAE2BM46_9LAMI|nr:hypothetical protein Sango_2107300 [Sesamum angolense]
MLSLHSLNGNRGKTAIATLFESLKCLGLSYLNLEYLALGMVSIGKNAAASTVKSRKLKEKIDPPSSNRDDAGLVTLEDYRPIDPVPNSKASIRPGPIQHGTPLMPYIPRPSPPPGRPKRGG